MTAAPTDKRISQQSRRSPPRHWRSKPRFIMGVQECSEHATVKLTLDTMPPLAPNHGVAASAPMRLFEYKKVAPV